MTSTDPLLSQLSELDPARGVEVDGVTAHRVRQRVLADMASEGHVLRQPSRWSRVRSVTGWAPGVLAVLLSALVVVVAVTSLHGRAERRGRLAGGSSSPAAMNRQALLDVLGVLRRPQTAADRAAFKATGLARTGIGMFPLLGRVVPSSARVATRTSWGSRVVLALTTQGRLVEWSGHGGGGDATAAIVRAGEDFSYQGSGVNYAGGSTGVRLEVVVPDGVAHVVFVFPRSGTGSSAGPRYRQLRSLVAVHGNVAAVEVRRPCCGSGVIPMIWYSAGDKVIARIGHPQGAGQTGSTSAPSPAPATAASRRAEHDPATPNPVTVTPISGNPHTTFHLTWKLLLTGAVYQFDPIGPQGADCYGANAIPGGLTGGTNNVRGQIYGEALGPLRSEPWCPGTYRVSVNVLAVGPGQGALRPAPGPFGSVSFTVR